MKEWVTKKYSDVKIINSLSMMVNKNHIHKDNRDRGGNRALDVGRLLEIYNAKIYNAKIYNGSKIRTYLDIGAGDCVITKSIADYLKIDTANIYALDIDSWGNKQNKDNDNKINYLRILPPESENEEFKHGLEKESFHHIKNASNVIKELYKLLKPNGVVIIREHNADTEIRTALCHVEHLLYSYFADKMPMVNFFKEYYGRYYSIKEMIGMFSSAGFESVYTEYKDNPTQYYYQIFSKISI